MSHPGELDAGHIPNIPGSQALGWDVQLAQRCSSMESSSAKSWIRHAPLGCGALFLALARVLMGAEITVNDEGVGTEFMGGAPITLPGGALSTNAFGDGVFCIRNRPHCVHPAVFDSSGRLTLEPAAVTNAFPAYLAGQPFVWFLQNVRHYTNYSCTITVDVPATFYLLLDNRLNDFGRDSELNDPSLGAPDTAWVLTDGWERVSTGLSPSYEGKPQGDYLMVDEGCNGSPNNFYAIYARQLSRPGSITLHSAYEGNIYCVVINTNQPGLRPTSVQAHSASSVGNGAPGAVAR